MLSKRIVSVTVAALLLVALVMSGLLTFGVKEVSVAGVKFCVPNKNLRSGSLLTWLSTPAQGVVKIGEFLYQLDVADDNFVTHLRGLVTEGGRYINWHTPTSNEQYTKYLASKIRVLVNNGHYIASVVPSSGSHYDRWLVWKPDTQNVTLESPVTNRSELIATCFGSSQNVGELLCKRIIYSEPIAISYTFYGEHLNKIEMFDHTILKEIDSWRCNER